MRPILKWQQPLAWASCGIVGLKRLYVFQYFPCNWSVPQFLCGLEIFFWWNNSGRIRSPHHHGLSSVKRQIKVGDLLDDGIRRVGRSYKSWKGKVYCPTNPYAAHADRKASLQPSSAWNVNIRDSRQTGPHVVIKSAPTFGNAQLRRVRRR